MCIIVEFAYTCTVFTIYFYIYKIEFSASSWSLNLLLKMKYFVDIDICILYRNSPISELLKKVSYWNLGLIHALQKNVKKKVTMAGGEGGEDCSCKKIYTILSSMPFIP